MAKQPLGVMLWPNEQNFTRFRAICDDDQPESLADYRANVRRKSVERGIDIDELVLLDFDPDQLANWCRARTAPVDAQNRSLFAAMLYATQRERNNGPAH